jgi:UDP-N-acetylglucosamine diphosphorylase / glucose-1-phosphate thymidylyltransferase / UDP-N-acetylgalactosamine diphosphorylase / glucosamine-1-phosphate N-acetyltransferase / galactosamine-1-phosphate N-acetyltransferase
MIKNFDRLNIVIPMAGASRRFVQAGEITPKPFIDINGKSMIDCVLNNLYHPSARYILIAKKNHIDQYSSHFKYLKKKYNCVVLSLTKSTDGPLCTCLKAHELINNNEPLIFANCDQLVDLKINDWIIECKNKKADGSILIFNDNNPKWSFVSINSDGLIDDVKEKKVISNNATVGIYFYRKGSYFVNSALSVIADSEKTNNEYYVAPTYNYMIEKKMKIFPYKIPIQKMHGVGTPEDLKTFLSLDKKYDN